VVHAAHGRASAADDSIVDLAGDRITRPELARLATTINQQGQGHPAQLQDWLANRGLAPYDPQQQPSSRKETHLQRLSRVSGAKFDLAFLTVMTARHRAGNSLAATELRDGSLPEVRQLAQQLVGEQQAQIDTMTAWKRAWSKPKAKPDGQTAGDRPRDDRRERSTANRNRGQRRRRNSQRTSRQSRPLPSPHSVPRGPPP
jgi:predicted outer membrane protein